MPAQVGDQEAFATVLTLIAASRKRALRAVNSTLISLYWESGAMISRKIEAADWGTASWTNSRPSSLGRNLILEGSPSATYFA